jgi:hypothetical protein
MPRCRTEHKRRRACFTAVRPEIPEQQAVDPAERLHHELARHPALPPPPRRIEAVVGRGAHHDLDRRQTGAEQHRDAT